MNDKTMKWVASIVTVVTAIFISGPTSAFSSAELACIEFSEDNQKIMYLRQNGMSVLDAIEAMEGSYRNLEIQNLINRRVIDAYENYDQVVEDQRGITAHLFATEAMLSCLVAINQVEKK